MCGPIASDVGCNVLLQQTTCESYRMKEQRQIQVQMFQTQSCYLYIVYIVIIVK